LSRTLSPIQSRTESRNRDAREVWTYAGHYDPGFTDAVCAAIDHLSTLKPNWDGYGAPVISPAIIAAAKKFVRALPENLAYRPRVVPMSTGNLQLEWHHGSKTLELEFETDKVIHFLQWHPEAGVEEEGIFPATDVDWACGLIQWFMNGTTCV
jgi:hypothetical protein